VSPNLTSALTALAVTALVSAIAIPLRAHLAPVNLAMLYLLALAAVAARRDRLTTVLTALLGIAAFDFFCVPPYGTLEVSDSEYGLTFAALLAVGLLIHGQTQRIRAQARDATAREARTRAVYELSESLAGKTRVFEIAQAAAELITQATGARTILFLPEQGELTFRRRTSQDLPIPAAEETVAAWSFKNARKAGLGVDRLPRASAQYIPLKGTRGTLGVMAVIPSTRTLPPEPALLADLFAHQVALAIERAQHFNATQSSRLQIQTEQMRSSLLSAVSHDLRTPLAAIAGAASTLRASADRLPSQIRAELLDSITAESERLGRLVGNLLDMTRFEAGAVTLHKAACPLEDILSVALERSKTSAVTVNVPHDLPPISADEVLLGQAFLNILENTAKYAPGPIEITAASAGNFIEVEIRDHGPGFTPGEEHLLFDKFYRSRTHTSVRGAGLGLAITKAVVEAHGGTINAYNHPQGGAVLKLRLPGGVPADAESETHP
jgi:two-component system, OmpR family, sensor histidine kinase KdpD